MKLIPINDNDDDDGEWVKESTDNCNNDNNWGTSPFGECAVRIFP